MVGESGLIIRAERPIPVEVSLNVTLNVGRAEGISIHINEVEILESEGGRRPKLVRAMMILAARSLDRHTEGLLVVVLIQMRDSICSVKSGRKTRPVLITTATNVRKAPVGLCNPITILRRTVGTLVANAIERMRQSYLRCLYPTVSHLGPRTRGIGPQDVNPGVPNLHAT